MLCYLVEKSPDGSLRGQVTERGRDELPPGDVLVRVAWSSLNYKDALAATGHPGVNRQFPHVPGIDAAGTVVRSNAGPWREGEPVLVCGFQMGTNRWGGWAQYLRVPEAWIVPLPAGLSLRDAMIFGTAGFTAALSVEALAKHSVTADAGEVVVSGASGGVGSMAVALLAKLGYRVAAASGKPAAGEFLSRLGASRLLAREEVDDRGDRPLLSERWAGGIDCVGGNILSTILRATRHGGCVTACGLTAGPQLAMTVYPFILRGITLVGIDVNECPRPLRVEMWRRLSVEWRPDLLAEIAREVTLADLPREIENILAGRITGRVLVRIP
jgi:acrylyl-CoA reductase (NADPH)